MKTPKLLPAVRRAFVTCAALAVGSTQLKAQATAETSRLGALQVEVAEPMRVQVKGEGSEFASEGRLLGLKDGSLLLYSSKFLLRSTDQGRTWLKDAAPSSGLILERRNGSFYLLDEQAKESAKPGHFLGRRLRLKSLHDLAAGTPLRWEEIPITAERVVALTGDDGKTYPASPRIQEPILELSDGTLVVVTYGNFLGDNVPMEGFVATKGEKWFKYRTFLLSSTDGGDSWGYFSTVAYDGKTGQESFCEPDMVDFGHGELLVVMRTGRMAPMYQARSLDGGKTWGKPELLRTLGLQPKLALLENGVLVCSFGWRPLKNIPAMVGGGPYVIAAVDYQKRYQSETGIENPSAAAGDYVMFSLDQGHTWSKPRKIAEPLTSGYTQLAAAGPDSCLVLSKRIVIPGESDASVARKWEHEWTTGWSGKSKRVVEGRLIRIRR